MRRTIELKFKKSTKGTHVYESDDFGVSFYLPKLLLEKPTSTPATITMTLEADEGK